MGFWKEWSKFVKENAVNSMKRISIVIGSFLFLLVTSIPLGLDSFLIVVYAGFVETSGIILMTLFGKNGNGHSNSTNGVGSNDPPIEEPTPK